MSANEPQESVAIIGMAGRFPQAHSVEAFWRNLRDGRECVSFFDDDQVQWLPIEYPPRLDDPRYVKARAVMEKPEWFDAAFFGMTPKEAEIMDPQHRIFLECAWEALEDAGCNPETHDGLIGVFAGASLNTYLFTNLLTNPEMVKEFGLFSSMIMNSGDFVPTRVSYKFNLRGPSLNVQTACSTSLVAVCLAAQNLLSYRCDVALAGGVSITFPPHRGQHHQEGGILSPDGHCRPFDAAAAGTVLGDGAGVVVLKRLSEAQADGDNILAVIKGTAINNDGSVKIGYTAPSSDGQAEVIALAQAEAGVAPETISYIEAHGTGTPLGDPIEIAGLTKAFGLKSLKPFCAVGSVKSNIGHLDIAAGIAGLIKTVLALHHGEIPPSLHFEKPNPQIDFSLSPFFVNSTLRPWPRQATLPRRAGVSSFGIGGTNAHVVLEEAPAAAAVSASRSRQLLVLSAKTPTALETAANNLAEYLQAQLDANGTAEVGLADVAYTLQTGRKGFAHRRALMVENVSDAIRALRAKSAPRMDRAPAEVGSPKVAFLFPGQGAQTINMARGLYETETGFRAHVDRCCELLRQPLGLDLRVILFPAVIDEAGATLLSETRHTQPALFVIEHALAQLWIEWGVTPAAMIGHSLGEYVAACLAGVMSLEDALVLVAERGRLMQAQPPGAMLAVRQSEEQVRPFLAGNNLALAAVNAPGLCVVSGPFDAVEVMERKLAAGAIPFKRLATSHAFHSPMMDPVLAPLAGVLSRITLHPPKLPWVSNVTGTWITPEQATSAAYWMSHVRQTVRFAAGIEEIIIRGHAVLLEVGPGRTLAGLVRQHPAFTKSGVTVVASLGRTRDGDVGSDSDIAAVLSALGELWTAGVVPHWRAGFHRHEQRRIVPLPTYPFERKRYWIEPAAGTISFVEGAPQEHGGAKTREPAPCRRETLNTPPTGADAISSGMIERVTTMPTTLDTLRAIFEELSGIDLQQAGSDQTFYQLGFDSLFLTQASRAVSERFQVEVTFRQLREELLTLGKLAGYLDSNQARELGGTVGARSETNRVQSVALEQRLPLTDAQQEMWFATQLGSAVASAYHEEATLHLSGSLYVPALHRALERLVARHESLRTTFNSSGQEQIIVSAREVSLPLRDLSDGLAEDIEADAIRAAQQEIDRAFDLVAGPLFRGTLLRLDTERHVLVLVVHHIICDGWSLGTLVRELAEFYTAEIEGRPTILSAPVVSGGDEGESVTRRRSAAKAEAEVFWLEQFSRGVPVLELPADRARPTQRTYAGGFALHALDPEVAVAMKRLCAQHGCTLFTALLASFNVLLHRLSDQDDLVVGVPAAAQVMSGRGDQVGHFANLLAVRSQIINTETFAEYLDAVRGHLSEALDHWQYPFSALVQRLKLPRDSSRMPLANVVFNSSQLRGSLDFSGLRVEATVTPKRFVAFDLNVNFAVSDNGISLGCYYSRELFDGATIIRWIGHFETLLGAIAKDPETPLGTLEMVTPNEREMQVERWNATWEEYPRECGSHSMFFAEAERAPHAVALVHGAAELSYGELARRADVLADLLRGLGVGPDVPVGICLERSFAMIVAVLATLRAGGAYVPLDPGYPADRLAFMLEDSGAPLLLTQRALRERAGSPAGLKTMCVDENGEVDEMGNEATPATGRLSFGKDTDPDPEHLAYIIYTSGSTGKPKGVAMPHRALGNLISWQLRASKIGRGGRTLQFSSLSFDVSFQEIFATLSGGGTLVLVDDHVRRDTRALWRLLLQQRIERLFLPFVALQQLAEAFRPGDGAGSSLREVITAGEALQITPRIASMFDALRLCTLHNQYGPSETHVASEYLIPGAAPTWEARPPIGRPIANLEIYLLDSRFQVVPIGVAGELFIGGAGLARGYWRDEDMTRARFVPHPFRADARLYRTGDRARYRADGSIDFLGRTDQQVKFNGYRIEPGEIEVALARHPAVGECAVVVRELAGEPRRLVAYVVPGASQPEPEKLRRHLQQSLPDYMVPATFVILKALPLTPSGKVDRRALPAPVLDAAAGDTESAPRSMAEELLAQIWGEVLCLEQVDVHANFFELGGHSLLATQVITRVHDALEVELPLARFFIVPTIAQLAPVLEELLLEDIKAAAHSERDSLATSVMAAPNERR